MIQQPIIILPLDFFRRVEKSPDVIFDGKDYIENDIKISKSIWLLASPTTGHSAPVDFPNYKKRKRNYPAEQVNGLYFSWVGSSVDTKCLVTFDPVVPESYIPLANDEELYFIYMSIKKEREEISRLYKEKEWLTNRVWNSFRQCPGDLKLCEYRNYLELGEVLNLIFGPLYNIGAKIINKRLTALKNFLDKREMYKYQNSYKIRTENLYIVKTLFLEEIYDTEVR